MYTDWFNVVIYDDSMLETKIDGESFLHRELWRVVEMQSEIVKDRQERDAFSTDLIAMVFAFHTVEAYLNFLGGLLAPEIWKNERKYFRKEPYRGFEGKLRKVMELVSLEWDESNRPLKTILELKDLRDSIAHPKPEKVSGTVTVQGTEVPFPLVVFTLSKTVTPERHALAVADVEEFVGRLHLLAKPKVDDIWFGNHALRGPEFHVGHSSQLR